MCNDSRGSKKFFSAFGACRSVCLSLVILCLSLPAQALINGMATYERFGQERYIAVLHLAEATTDVSAALAQSEGAAMEYVISTDELSRRRLRRNWLEGLTVNANEAELQAHAEDLKALLDLMKDSLVRGDRLKLEKHTDHTRVTLNDVELGRLSSAGLFNLMLSTWLGDVPPSTEFRVALLSAGDIPAAIESRYTGLQPSADRAQQIAQIWGNVEQAESDTAQPTSAAPQQQVALVDEPDLAVETEVDAPKLDEEPAEVAAAEPPVAEQSEAAQPVQSESAQSEPVQSKPGQPEPAETEVAVAAVAQVASSSAEVAADTASAAVAASAAPARKLSEQIADSEVEPPATEEPVEQAADSAQGVQVAALQSSGSQPLELQLEAASQAVEDDDALLNVDDILAVRRYYDEVKREIFQRVIYPERALRLGRESQVALDIRIDDNGKLLDVEVADETEHKSFERAAVRAAKSAAPFPRPPAGALEDEAYRMRMVVNFKLAKRS